MSIRSVLDTYTPFYVIMYSDAYHCNTNATATATATATVYILQESYLK
jgi:hypothetical protein